MSPRTLLYLSRADVERAELPMARVVDAVEAMFREKGGGRTQMPPKLGVHPSRDGFLHAMPAYVPANRALGLKWVSAFPENKPKGLPYVAGLIVLNDPGTGLPLAVMDATWITAVRTAAATAVAAKHLARPDSATAGIVGCGVQGRTNLEALSLAFPLRLARAYDLHPDRAESYASEMEARLGFPVEPVSRTEDAVRGLDLVVTGGRIVRDPDPPIAPGWLAAGAFGCALDYDASWQKAALAEVERLVTDDLGQLEAARAAGYFRDAPEPSADLGDIVAGLEPGRTSDGERTLSLNLGLALQDVVTAVRVYRRALERGLGTELPL